MPFDPAALPLAFRCGQLDALARTMVMSPTLYSAEMRHALGLRLLGLAWTQYREDRALAASAALVGAEASAERDAFLGLLGELLPPGEELLTPALATVRRTAIRPLAAEAAETAQILEHDRPLLAAVREALANPALPTSPLVRTLDLVARFRYSQNPDAAALTATAQTPCWALNLVAAANGAAFALTALPLPIPGVVTRRLFRADRTTKQAHAGTATQLGSAVHAVAAEIARLPRAISLFAERFPALRGNSRLLATWLLVFGLSGVTAAQLARALPCTKAGAGKLLRQLESQGLVRSGGAYAPFVPAVRVVASLPDGMNGTPWS